MMSGSAYNYFAFTEMNHLDRIEECSMSTNSDKMMEYLKWMNAEELVKCHFDFEKWGKTLKPKWTPTLEHPGAKGAFITQTPDDIYNSDKAPVIDTMMSFTSAVFTNFKILRNPAKIQKISILPGTTCFR